MRKLLGVFLVVTMLCTSPPISAQMLELPISFDCDVPAGRLSDWSGTLVSREAQVRGTIEFVELREHERYRPVASVILTGDTKEARFGLQLYVERDESVNFEAAIVNPGDPSSRTKFASYPWKDNPMAFTVTWTNAGEIKVMVGDASAALKIGDLRLNKLSLSCSTAEVRFTDIVITTNGDT